MDSKQSEESTELHPYDDLRDYLEEWLTEKEVDEKKVYPTIGTYNVFPTKGMKLFTLVTGARVYGTFLDSTTDYILIKKQDIPSTSSILLIRKDKIVSIEEIIDNLM